MSAIQDTMQKVMKTAIALAPDRWIPGGKPDPLIDRKHGRVGSAVSRIDGPLKVKGAARFAAEIPIEGMTYAALAFSTIAKGRIASLDTREAEAAPGVVLVMTHKNAPRLKAPPLFMSAPEAVGPSTLPVMQDDSIHWNGEPIAVVLAETQEQADHAASLIIPTYATEDAVTNFDVVKANARPAPPFMGEPLRKESGDAEGALARALHKVDSMFRTPRHNHNPIELHAVTLAWDGDELMVHDTSQCVQQTAWTLADIFGIKKEQIRVSSPYVGGGFGSKTMWSHHILAAAAAKLAKRPVRMVLSREGVYRTVGGRTLTEQRVALGADADGRFVSMIHTGVVAMTKHNNMPEAFITPAQCLYATGSMKLGVDVADLDMLANTFMRAPGESVGSFALECAIDELAEKMGLDPIELRRRNEPQKDPTTGLPFSSRHLVEAYRDGAARFGWDKRNKKPGTRREGEWLIGMGCATGTYPYYRMPGARRV